MQLVTGICILLSILAELEATAVSGSARDRDIGKSSWYGLWPASALEKTVLTKGNVQDIWSDCSKSSDAASLVSVSLNPDQPQRGYPLSVDAKVKFSQEISRGTVNIYIKYKDMIPVLSKTYDLCGAAGVLNENCPLEAGVHEATLKENIPSYAPSGQYTGTIKAKDSSGNELVCISIDMDL